MSHKPDLKALYQDGDGVVQASQVVIGGGGKTVISYSDFSPQSASAQRQICVSLAAFEQAFGIKTALADAGPTLLAVAKAVNKDPNVDVKNKADVYGVLGISKDSSASEVLAAMAEPYKVTPADYTPLLPWFAELKAAGEYKVLELRAIKSWALSHRLEDSTAQFFKDMVAPLTAAPWTAAIAGVMEFTPWLTYRVAANSTVAILQRIVHDHPSWIKEFFTAEEIAKIEAASILDQVHGVPQSAIAKAKIFLEATDADIPSWYQGNKAKALYSPIEAKKVSAVIKKLVDKKMDLSATKAAVSEEEIVSFLSICDASKDKQQVVKDRYETMKAIEVVREYATAKKMVPIAIPDDVDFVEVIKAAPEVLGQVAKISRALQGAKAAAEGKPALPTGNAKEEDDDGIF